MRKVLYILGQLSDDDAEWLATVGHRQTLKKGQILVTQGQAVPWLFFILDGQFEVTARGAGRLAVVGCGEIIGEISLIDSHPPTASVTAIDGGVVLAIGRDELQKKLAADISFAAHFYRAVATFLAERMRATVKMVGNAGKSSAPDEDDDELDINVLDNVHLAGARFDRILKRFQR